MFKFHDEHGHETDFTAPYVTGKVSRTAPITLDEYRFVASVAKGTPKITMPAPSTMHFYRCNDYGDAAVYADARAFFSDLGEVYQQEIAELAMAGCRYVQLDEVALAVLCDPAARVKVRTAGQDPEALVELYVDAINEAVKNRPPEMVIGVHMCAAITEASTCPRAVTIQSGCFSAPGEPLPARIRHAARGDFAPLRLMPKTRAWCSGCG